MPCNVNVYLSGDDVDENPQVNHNDILYLIRVCADVKTLHRPKSLLFTLMRHWIPTHANMGGVSIQWVYVLRMCVCEWENLPVCNIICVQMSYGNVENCLSAYYRTETIILKVRHTQIFLVNTHILFRFVNAFVYILCITLQLYIGTNVFSTFTRAFNHLCLLVSMFFLFFSSPAFVSWLTSIW